MLTTTDLGILVECIHEIFPASACALCNGRRPRTNYDRTRPEEIILTSCRPRLGEFATWNPYIDGQAPERVPTDAGRVHVAGVYGLRHIKALVAKCPLLHTIEVAPSTLDRALECGELLAGLGIGLVTTRIR